MNLGLIQMFLNLNDAFSRMVFVGGDFSYIILFLVIFLETGLVVTPFLPGDSLLFLAGIFAKQGVLNIFLLFFILVFAAILGDSVNYFLGKSFGRRFLIKFSLLNQRQFDRAERFYAKHGNITIFIGRFIPIIRTFVPFMAGIGKMNYRKFVTYNVLGAIVWVGFFLSMGYFFGGLSIVKDNLLIITILVIVISFLPILIKRFK